MDQKSDLPTDEKDNSVSQEVDPKSLHKHDMEGRIPSIEKTGDHAIDEQRDVKDTVSTDTRAELVTPCEQSVLFLEDLSIDSNGDENNFLTEESGVKAQRIHGVGGNMMVAGGNESSKANLIAATDTCTSAKTLGDRAMNILDDPTIESNGVVSCSIATDQEKNSASQLAIDLGGRDNSYGDSLSNKGSLENLTPIFEKVGLGEDQEIKPETETVANFGEAESIYRCEDFKPGDLILSATNVKTALEERTYSISEGLCSHTDDNQKEGCIVHIETEDGVSQGMENCDPENKVNSSISATLLKTPEEASSTDKSPVNCKLEDLEVAVDESKKVSEVLIHEEDIVESANFVHKASSTLQEDTASLGGGCCATSNMHGSSSPSLQVVSSPISPSKAIDDENVDVEGSKDDVHHENEEASNECELHGYSMDKDGGSSMDSTAGTGWKLQGTDGCIAPEEGEETNSIGGEDSASRPACTQPSTHHQQRKKINIHHQLVREIVKIQHGREQYDREQAERQIQAHQAANVALVESSDVKVYKTSLLERKQLRDDAIQRGPTHYVPDRHDKESLQKHGARNKKTPVMHGKSRTPLPKAQESSAAKEHGKAGRSKQHSLSIYRPPVARESLAAGSQDQRNLGELDTSHRQSGAYAINESVTTTVSEPHFSFVGSSDTRNNETSVKLVQSISGEQYSHRSAIEPEDESPPGMGIKVTFDTEKQLRHIEFSSGLDSTRGRKHNERVGLATSQKSSDFESSKNPAFNSSLPSFVTSTNMSKVPAGFGPPSSKGNDQYSTQADKTNWSQVTFSTESSQGRGANRSSWSKASSQSGETDRNSWSQDSLSPEFSRGGDRNSWSLPTESSESRGKVGKPLNNNPERKKSFFEQADSNAFVHNPSSWSQKSPSLLIHHGSMDGHIGHSIHVDNVKHSAEPAVEMRTPSALLPSFSTPTALKTAPPGPLYRREMPVSNAFPTPFLRTDDPNKFSRNMQAGFHPQQFHVSRSQQDAKGKQSFNDGGREKRQTQFRHAINKESGSPFPAMMKDLNRSQNLYSPSASQPSGDAQPDFQGFAVSRNVDHRRGSREHLQESFRSSQADSARKGSMQNFQPLASPMPLKESLFCTMPMQEKWGDIVDDSPDTYDFSQMRGETDRDGGSGYGKSNYGNVVMSDAASFKSGKASFKDTKQDKMVRMYGGSGRDNDVSQNSKFSCELVQDYESPARKSVFERLGPQNNYQESILGPPPKVLDNRGVLKFSPDALISNAPNLTTLRGFDTGFHGSPQVAPHLSNMTPQDSSVNINDEGREVVIQAYTDMKQKRSKRELYVPRRGSLP